jgi:soluble P-type ATPase
LIYKKGDEKFAKNEKIEKKEIIENLKKKPENLKIFLLRCMVKRRLR